MIHDSGTRENWEGASLDMLNFKKQTGKLCEKAHSLVNGNMDSDLEGLGLTGGHES